MRLILFFLFIVGAFALARAAQPGAKSTEKLSPSKEVKDDDKRVGESIQTTEEIVMRQSSDDVGAEAFQQLGKMPENFMKRLQATMDALRSGENINPFARSGGKRRNANNIIESQEPIVDPTIEAFSVDQILSKSDKLDPIKAVTSAITDAKELLENNVDQETGVSMPTLTLEKGLGDDPVSAIKLLVLQTGEGMKGEEEEARKLKKQKEKKV